MKFKTYLKEKKKFSVLLIGVFLLLTLLAGFNGYMEGTAFSKGRVTVVDIKNKGRLVNVKSKEGKDHLEGKVYLKSEKDEKASSPNEKSMEKTKDDGDFYSTRRQVEKGFFNDGQKVRLPEETEKGRKLEWYIDQDYSFICLMFFPLFIIYFLYRREVEKLKIEAESLENSFVCNMPTFVDQIIMLLESGMVFTQSFNRIVEDYKKQKEPSLFQKKIIEIGEEAQKTNVDLIKVLQSRRQSFKNRNFTRIVNIIVDNQYKGTDLKEKLEITQSTLWNERKLKCEELSRKAETKLTFPMGVLLLILIFITAAPAIIQMKEV